MLIFVHLTVVDYFYFIFEKNYCLNKIYHIFKMLQSCGQKRKPVRPPPFAEFTKSLIRPCDACIQKISEMCTHMKLYN